MAKLEPRQWIVIFTVSMAAMLQLIDMSIVNVSIFQMMGNLGATLSEIGWVVTAYAAANVIMIALSGWLAAKFGRRTYFAASIIFFTIASIFCGTSTNVWELVVFRFLQGLGGGGLLATAQAILVETFPKEDLGLANAIYGLGVIIGPTIGPTLGGYITDHFSWHWIFFINIPIGILATVLTLLFIEEPAETRRIGRMDWLGLALLVVSVGALQIVLERGQEEDWFASNYITILTVVAVLAVVAFIWRTLTTEDPVVDISVMKNRTFSVGIIFNFIVGFGLFASVFIIPVFVENLLGFTALDTGLLLMPGAIATAIAMPIVGKLLQKRYPPLPFTAVGFFLFFIFCYMLSRSAINSGESDFFWPLLIRGAGLGLIFIPLNTILLSELKGKEIPQGTALSNMFRQLGGSFGIALMTTFVDIRTAFHVNILKDNISIYNTVSYMRIKQLTGAFLSRGFSLENAQAKALAIVKGSVIQQGLLLTYDETFLLVGLFFIACIPLLLLFKWTKRLDEKDLKKSWGKG